MASSAILIEEDEDAENGTISNKSSSVNKVSSDKSVSSALTDENHREFTEDDEFSLKNDERPSTKIDNYKCHQKPTYKTVNKDGVRKINKEIA